MNKKLNFSVLMSVYKKETCSNLRESFDSIINQTYKPSEIILVEDGPLTLELNEVIKEYCAKYEYIKVVPLEKNSGLGIALNKGLNECKYEYIARMDTDDIALKDRFEIQFKYLQEHPEVDVLGGNINEFDNETKQVMHSKTVPQTYEEIVQYVKTRNPINHMTVVFKKSKVLEAGSYMDCPYFEDYYLWARMIARGNIIENVPNIILNARAGKDMVKRRGSFSYIKCIIRFENKLYDLKLISRFDKMKNILIRSIVAIVPNNIRFRFYQKALRK